MGTGIAQVAAQMAKKKVILMDANKTQAEKAVKFIGASK
jgi:3-hydroxyacyl-CoA dehydrogenase